MLNIGYSNSVIKERVIGLLKNEGAALRRYRSRLKNDRKLIDATCGHKARSIVVMNSDHIFLSAIAAETLVERFNKTEKNQK